MGAEPVNEEQMVIVEYIKEHFVAWLNERNILPFPQNPPTIDTQLLERMVRVEETLKRQNDKFDHQNEKFDLQNDKFDMLISRMDQRFSEIDRRLNRQSLYHLATFSAIVGSAVAIILKN
ncbi:MAG: hypothetical protein B6241_05975 [Spirochaetaceae bacterium 4572_59]|nr:MAG: hypothetical protein B6241_05975 [Spirochaetaceae bacterium 4572_59]